MPFDATTFKQIDIDDLTTSPPTKSKKPKQRVCCDTTPGEWYKLTFVERVRQLAYDLRKQQLFEDTVGEHPNDFYWDFGCILRLDPFGCGTDGCALGLAITLYKKQMRAKAVDEFEAIEKIFGPAPSEQFMQRLILIFGFGRLIYGKTFADVRPIDVATKLDRLANDIERRRWI